MVNIFRKRTNGFLFFTGFFFLSVCLFASATSAQTPLNYYKFDEGSGNAVYDSGSASPKINGSIVGFGIGFASGKISNGLTFSGLPWGVVSLNGADITTDWSVAVWVNRDGNTGAGTILSGPSSAIRLEQYNQTYKPGITKINCADWTFAKNTYSTPLNTWVHLAFVKTTSPARIKLYVNGVYADSMNNVVDCPRSWIGSKTSSPCDVPNATFDELKMYNVALTAAQVTTLFNSYVTLTMTSDGNGTTTPSGSLATTSVTLNAISATPSANYDFSSWSVTSGAATFGNPSSSTTTVTLSTNATVKANFALRTFQLQTVSSIGGTITAPTVSPTTVTIGAATTITAAANAGYSFVNWTVDSGSASIASPTSASTTVTLSNGNARVKANFLVITYQLTASASTGGTISAPASSPVTVNHGAATAIAAVAGTGYNFVNWTVGSGSASIAAPTSPSTTVTLTNGNAQVNADFVLKTYQITVTASPGGSITAPASLPTTVQHGVPITLTATPGQGLVFAGWTVLSGTASFADQSQATTAATFTDGNATIVAGFTRVSYGLSTVVNGSGAVTPSGPQAIRIGDSLLLIATPGQGGRFSGWSLASGNAAIAKPCALTTYVKTLSSDVVVSANFINASEYASPSHCIAVCGYLTDPDGKPIGDGSPQTVDAAVHLFSSASGPDTVYEETFLQANSEGVSVDKGIFIARLGTGVSLTDVQSVVRTFTNLYAEITITTPGQGSQTLLPRMQLNAAAYTVAAAAPKPVHGSGDPVSNNISASFGTFYVNDSDNSTWMKTQNGWGKIGN